MMKRTLQMCFATVGVGLLGLASANALLLRESQIFVQTSGNLGVVATHEGWSGDNTNVFVVKGSGSLDGTGLGLVESFGDKAEISANTTHAVYCLFASSRQFPAGCGTNLYFSFLYRFNNAADVSASGEVLAAIIRQNSSSGTNFAILARNSGGSIQLGLLKPTASPVWASTSISVGQTIFVVARQQMLSGSANDVIDLWINPPPASFGADEDAVPTPTLSTSEGAEDTSTTGPGRFYLDSGLNATFDELRIATTWAEVTPKVGTCVPPEVVSQPTDATVTEGALATFRISSRGTSKMYQWQESVDGGNIWVDVTTGTGGITESYTTPLAKLSDSGKKFRCIVTSACTNLIATSQVATLTVVPAVKTPPGLVVNECWEDNEFNDHLEVTTNNIKWYFSSGMSTGSSPDWGVMFLEYDYTAQQNLLYLHPPEGSSMLVIGYFVEATNQPVHLDVGRGLRFRLSLRPNLIQVESNGGFRLGLFDYADGATRVTANGFSGSAGNGSRVLGYMVNVNFGRVFGESTPIGIYRRANLDSGNLMGTLADFVSLGSGPPNMAGASAFQDYEFYTFGLDVDRIGENSVRITASITGGGTNWSYSVIDTNYPLHRFDAFAFRVPTGTNSAWQFTLSNVLVSVETVQIPIEPPTPEPIIVQRSGNNVILSWSDPKFSLYSATNVAGPYQKVPGATSPYTNAITDQMRFFRLVWSSQEQ